MQKEAKQFWDAIAGKVRETVRGMTRKTLQAERYDVTTAPNSATGKIGVTLPFGGEEITIPYSAECAGAQVGDTVLVVWWNTMSTAKAWFMGNGPTETGIESGSGYCKLPDGTLIQWGEISVGPINVDTAWGSMYESTEISIPGQTFQTPFISTPTLILRLRVSPVAFLEDKINASATGLSGTFNLARPAVGYNCTGSIFWLATGRWK